MAFLKGIRRKHWVCQLQSTQYHREPPPHWKQLTGPCSGGWFKQEVCWCWPSGWPSLPFVIRRVLTPEALQSWQRHSPERWQVIAHMVKIQRTHSCKGILKNVKMLMFNSSHIKIMGVNAARVRGSTWEIAVMNEVFYYYYYWSKERLNTAAVKIYNRFSETGESEIIEEITALCQKGTDSWHFTLSLESDHAGLAAHGLRKCKKPCFATIQRKFNADIYFSLDTCRRIEP